MVHSFPDKPPPLLDEAHYIVIGSGIAGLYAALELSAVGSVVLITKNTLAESNSRYAQGGIAAALGRNDSPELHYQDTMMAGAGLCEPEAVLTLVYEGKARVKHLIELGVPFDLDTQGEPALTKEAAHSRRRILHADGDATGWGICRSLIQRLGSTATRVYEHTHALALVTVPSAQGERCAGVVVVRDGELMFIRGGAVILCTGGWGRIYDRTTNPEVATGDGMMLAYNAGATLRDLEFTQFHPTALDLPPAPPFLISEAVRGEGAILLNHEGTRFMPRYHQQAELAPRDVVARAIFTEISLSEGKSVRLDLSSMGPEKIRVRFPNIYHTCLKYGLDITREPIPVAPAAHYVMGGVMTDLRGRTSVPGLFAAGEIASTRVHGANRLASNSLLEGLVFAGRIVDELIHQPLWIPETSAEFNFHYPPLHTDYAHTATDINFLRRITGSCLGIVRDQTGLKRGLEMLATFSKPSGGFKLEPAHLELQHMYGLARMMLQAALARTESRGVHFRSDFPTPSPKWRKHILFHHGKMEVVTE